MNYYVSLVNDLGNVLNYTLDSFIIDVKSTIKESIEYGYSTSEINSVFVLQNITGCLDQKEFNVENKVHELITSLINEVI